jgi:hypothetical protein
VRVALPADAGYLHAVAEAALFAADLEGDNESTLCPKLTRIVVLVSFLVTCNLIVKDAKQAVVRALRAEEKK